MAIFLNILFLVLGMVLLIKGADFFVSGASAVAKRLKVPSMFIGLTIVSLGTSLPELSVSITSAISNNIDMSVGNIVGSNLFNMLFVLGLVALFNPVHMDKSTNKIDFPFLIAITGILMLFGLDTFLDGASKNMLSRTESILLLVILVLYLSILIFNANRTHKRMVKQELYMNRQSLKEKDEEVKEVSQEKELKVWQIILYIVLGLGAVVFGGECVSTTASYLAIKMGMSKALVGLTIVAFGTSLPELVTSVVASKKGEKDLALGNVVGSNIMNIALILGSVGLIAQAPISTAILTDLIILFVSTIIFVVCCLHRGKISRGEGILFVCMYVAYIAFAIVRNYCF
ncbi:MAG: calcium/sodium antiporter [Clostridia bacterium]|nr:calcium/sodium antiporter [Clostridia bacterium]